MLMLQYKDIHPEDLSKLSVKSFTQVLINDYYPFIYAEMNRLENHINIMRSDHDIEILSSTQKKIYEEFDELYRKEKLVLFPYIIKLDDENGKAESCAPFKNIKLHYSCMQNYIQKAKELVSNYFVNNINDHILSEISEILDEIEDSMRTIQYIKEKHYFNPFKNCSGCDPLHD